MKVKCNSKICKEQYCYGKLPHEKSITCLINRGCALDSDARCVEVETLSPEPIDGTIKEAIK